MSKVVQRILHQLSSHHRAAALHLNNKVTSYADLKTQVDRIRHYLEPACAEQPLIGIESTHHEDIFAGILACWSLGKGFVPISPGNPAARNRRIAEQANIKTVLTVSERSIGTLQGSPISELPNKVEASSDTPIVNSGQIAYVLFTSGSSGFPKGVPISFGNLDAFTRSFEQTGITLSAADRVLLISDLGFDMSLLSYLTAWMAGACVYGIDTSGPKYLMTAHALDVHKISVLVTVPSLLQLLSSHFHELHYPHLHTTLLCGEALRERLALAWSQCAPSARLFNIYGPTECTVFTHAYELPTTKSITSFQGVVSIGKPHPELTAKVIGSDGRAMTCGEVGELVIHGPQVMEQGYLDPVHNEGSFLSIRDGEASKSYYRTGDLVRQDAEGNFLYCGRADNQVQLQGHRVELNEIIYQAQQIKPTGAFHATTAVSASGLLHLVLFCAAQRTEDFEQHLRQSLPEYMHPHSFIYLDELPSISNGKLDLVELERMARKRIETSHA